MTNLEIEKSLRIKANVTYAQEQEQRKTANRGFRKPEVKGSSPFAGSIESISWTPSVLRSLRLVTRAATHLQRATATSQQ